MLFLSHASLAIAVIATIIVIIATRTNGLDLTALRNANTALPSPGFQYSSNFAAFYHMVTPLDSRILPLCGNGLVDAQADYEAYYSTQPRDGFSLNLANFSNIDRTYYASTIQSRNFRIVADEVCDDGNRLDGDGCSADCLEFDAMLPSCQLAAPFPGQWEFLFYYNPSAPSFSAHEAVFGLKGDGIFSLTLTTTGINAEMLVNVGIAAQGATLVDSASGGSASGGGGPVIYMLQIGGSIATWSYGSGFSTLCSIAGAVSGNTFAQFIQGWSTATAGVAVVIATTGNSVVLADAQTCSVLQSLSYSGPLRSAPSVQVTDLSPTLPSCTTGVAVNGSRVWLTCGIVTANFVDGQPHGYWDGGAGELTGVLWTDMMNIALIPQIQAQITTEQRWNVQFSPEDGVMGQPSAQGVTSQIISLPIFYRILQSARALFVSTPAIQVLGSASLQAVASGGIDQCTSGGMCALDTPTEYNVLQPTSTFEIRSSPSSGQSYFDSLQSEVNSAPDDVTAVEGYTTYAATFGSLFQSILGGGIYGDSVKSMMQHGRTQALWFVQSGNLYEVGFGGTQYRFSNGQCLPSVLGTCSQPCTWAPLGGSCQPCSSGPASNAPNDVSVAFQLMCTSSQQACSSGGGSSGARRRRLLLLQAASPQPAEAITVQFAVITSLANATFPNASAVTCQPYVASSQYPNLPLWLCNVSVTGGDAASVMRLANALLARNGTGSILQRPAFVMSSTAQASPTTSSQAASSGLVLWQYVIIGVGGAVLLTGVIAVVVWCRRSRYYGYGKVAPSATPYNDDNHMELQPGPNNGPNLVIPDEQTAATEVKIGPGKRD